MKKSSDLEIKEPALSDSPNISEQLNAAQDLIKQYEAHIEKLKQTKKQHKDESLKKQIEANAEEIQLLEAQLQVLQDEHLRKKQIHAQYLEEVEKVKLKNKRLKNKNINLKSDTSEFNKNEQMSLITLTLSVYEKMLEQLEQDISKCKTERRALQSELQPIINEKDIIEKEIKDLGGSTSIEDIELTEQIEKLVSTMGTLEQSNNEINIETAALKKELEDFYAAQAQLDENNIKVYNTRFDTEVIMHSMYNNMYTRLFSPIIIPKRPVVRTLFNYKSSASKRLKSQYNHSTRNRGKPKSSRV